LEIAIFCPHMVYLKHTHTPNSKFDTLEFPFSKLHTLFLKELNV